ncbi:MAG: DUF6446 family protein [Rubricella sp.]
MNIRIVLIAMLAFALGLGGLMYYNTVYRWYERVEDVASVTVQGREIAVSGYEGIDSETSPLRIRGCFTVDPADFEGLGTSGDATPLIAPDWFDCFDAGQLTADLETGAALAYPAEDITPEAERTEDWRILAYVAVYPDGRAYLWRQRNEF